MDEEVKEFIKRFGSKKNENFDTRYQYSYVYLPVVVENPEEYIIPECMPACKALWDKNIETFMVSNNDDEDKIYVLLAQLSDENKKIFKQHQESDPRFMYDYLRDCYGLIINRKDAGAVQELLSLTSVFEMQDTFRYKQVSTKEEVDEYSTDPLYVPEEGRVYEDEFYFKWHQRYLEYLRISMQDDLATINENKDNVNGEIANLRDAFLDSERAYLKELLKVPKYRALIAEVNEYSTDEVYKIAQDLTERIEAGLVPDEEMDFAEKKLTILLASIQDKVLLKELVLLPDYDEEIEISIGGRH